MRGGLVKTDWTKAPFTAYYRNFNANACTGSSSTSSSSCSSSSKFGNALTKNSWQTQELDAMSRRRLRWVQKNYMIYNYCSDFKRFPQGPPPECRPSRAEGPFPEKRAAAAASTNPCAKILRIRGGVFSLLLSVT
ncbi:hypothetical protein Syun_009106 [Stephania yunnanensis]|uniref:Xyloglucan endo-transglycosylase C-terminal domain-containing protein n=1 Tax=Stephania yunnanensis TaxID=152371 RepID=A0AAP0KGC2_9MAGN